MKTLMLDKKYLYSALAGAAVVGSLGAAALSLADTTGITTPQPALHQQGVGGTVTAVSGNTITLTGMNGKTYTIDASNAAITKDETVSVSDIKVGDTIGAQGTVSGSSVTATNIHDGKLPPMGGGFGMRGRGIHGTVASVNGSTLTVTATDPQTNATQTYTVNASNARVLKGTGTGKPALSSLSAVLVGDQVMVAGPISGTTVTAKLLVDGPMPHFSPGGPGASQSTTTQQ